MAEADVTQPEPRDLRSQADEFSLRLYHLTNVAKLAAFACEARRVLEGVSDAVQYRGEMRKTLEESINAVNSWREMPDVTGDVLRELAKGLESLNDEWTSVIYDGTTFPEGSAA